ncbi:MAG: carotenoid 1,2-hydratase [Chlorobiaceae bacterium]|jgi:carotenoid 1,2-hydratase|nr:carotenoid 1,2-hydratase [Chlorobiaceae bacterium]NTV17507.1 carotenoid 1,2-hydratase [Chlorobiaceae bacterium]
MNITTKLDQELWHEMQEPGAYEWWYFDAEDKENGFSFVLIWFSGFPFSPYYTSHYEKWKNRSTTDAPFPSNYSGFSFQLYENGREIINFIREGRNELFESNLTDTGVRFEKNRFIHDPLRDEYTLDIDFSFPARHKEVKATFLFKSCRRIVYEKKDTNNNGKVPLHQWLLSVPRANVEGTIAITEQSDGSVRTIPVKAKGYHDHNLGAVPMQEYISRWYWGRAFSTHFDIIYYVVFFKNNDYQPLSLLVLHDNVSDAFTVYDTVRFHESNFRRGLFSPLHSRDLHLHFEHASLKIHHDTVLDAGPFYLRFASSISLKTRDKHIEEITGISEFLNPLRLESRFMRFFTRSRIWRDGEQSIMYGIYNSFKRSFDWNNR